MSAPLVLSVAVPPALADALATALERGGAARVVPCADAGEVIAHILGEPPALVVFGPAVPWEEVLDIVEELRGSAEARDCATLALAGAISPEQLRTALAAGLGDAIPDPHVPTLVIARARMLLEMRRLRREEAARVAELAALRAAQSESTDRQVRLLVSLLDVHEPGASERAERMAELALRVAERFEMPRVLLHDLEIAARLCDLGHLTAHTSEPLPLDAPAAQRWEHAPRNADLLAMLPGLAGAAGLIRSIGENWDGTGHPHHDLLGQIPLRSRILRVLHDHLDALEATGGEQEAVLQRMTEHAGTLYDPMVVVELRAVLEGLPGDHTLGDNRRFHVTELEPGMVLAEDLYADSGVKLLARDTTLTAATLEFLLRRHRVAPIPHAVAVRRAA